VAYDLAHAAAGVDAAGAVLEYGSRGEAEARIACAFVADVVHDVATTLLWREGGWGIEPGSLDAAANFVRPYRAPDFLAALCGEQGPTPARRRPRARPRHLPRFAEDEVRPIAEGVHRHNADIPGRIIEGLAELGQFGVSVPEEYGGLAASGEGEYLAMVVATEELSGARSASPGA
jgi:(2S)-methylsuccinyl-CoA dehydrogenase